MDIRVLFYVDDDVLCVTDASVAVPMSISCYDKEECENQDAPLISGYLSRIILDSGYSVKILLENVKCPIKSGGVHLLTSFK